MVITSVNNEYIKNIIKLKDKKHRDREGLFLVETNHLVEEAYKASLIKELIVLDQNEVFYEDVKITYVSYEVMKKISFLESPSSIIAVCYKKIDLPFSNKIIMLDNLQDPGNVGTIIRSANAFGFKTIVLSENTVNLYNDKVIRSSQGMMFHTNVVTRNLEDMIIELKEKGYVIYATDVNNGIDVSNISNIEKIAIIIGNEGQGISEKIKNLCDKNLYIKTSDSCESLNASVAASILMYEVSKL